MLEGSGEGDGDCEVKKKVWFGVCGRCSREKQLWRKSKGNKCGENEEEIKNIHTTRKPKRWWYAAWMKTQQECWGKEALNSLRAYAARIRPSSSLGVTGLTNPSHTSSPRDPGLPALPLRTLNLLNLTRFPLISRQLTLSPRWISGQVMKICQLSGWPGPQHKEKRHKKTKKKHLKKCVRTRTPVRKPLCARRRRAINIRHSGIRWWQSSSAGKLQVRCLKQVDGKSQLCHTHSWLAPPCLALLRHCIKNSLSYIHLWDCLFCAPFTASSQKHLLSKLLMKRAESTAGVANVFENMLAGWRQYLVAPHLLRSPPPPPAARKLRDFLCWLLNWSQSVMILLNVSNAFVSHRCANV